MTCLVRYNENFIAMKKKSFLLVLLMSLFIFSCKFQKQASVICEEDVEYPLIEDSVSRRITSIMSEWFDFYNINISDFKLINTEKINVESLKSDAASYFRKYTSSDNLFLPDIRDYSPNQRYHLNLLEATNVKRGNDSKWHLFGSNTDAQYIFLFDKEDSTLLLAAIHDVDNLSDAAFWLDNTTFVLSGKRFFGENESRYYLDVYNLAGGIKHSYCLKDSLLLNDDRSYFKEVNLKKRGVVVS